MTRFIKLLLFFLLCWRSVFAINAYMSLVQFIPASNDTIKIAVTTNFTLGPPAPPLGGFRLSQSNDTLYVDVCYDLSGGPWALVGSSRRNYLNLGVLPSNIAAIHVAPYVFYLDANYNYDTVKQSGDTTLLSALTTSTIELNKTAIWPNPVKHILTINQAADTKVELFDLAGHCLLTQRILSNYQEIQMSQYTQGVYLLRLTDKMNNSILRKIQKE